MCRNCNGKVKYALRRLLAPVRNKRASTLVIVLVTFAVLMVIGVSLMAVVSYNHKNASDYHRKQQAEYTARGVMEAIASAFANPSTGNGAAILSAVEGVGVGNTLEGEGTMQDANMGTYKVKLTLTKVDEIHAEVFANYLGMNYKVSAHFEKNSGGNALDPFRFLFFSNESGFTLSGGGSGTSTLDGKVFGGKNVNNWKNMHFKDKVITIGSLTVQDCIFDGDLIVEGSNVSRGGNTYNGKVYYTGGPVSGDPNDTTGPTIPGNGGIGFTAQVEKHQRIWSPIEYEFVGSKDAIKLGGVVYGPTPYTYTMPNSVVLSYNDGLTGTCADAEGNTINYDGEKITFANGDYIDRNARKYYESTGYVLDFEDLNKIVENTPSAFTNPQLSSIAQPASLASGSILAGIYRLSDNVASNVTMNTSGGDIHLFTDNDVTINGNLNITGDNNVYFHLQGNNTTFTVGSGGTAGLNDNEGIQLYVEGTNANLELVDGAKFRGYAYIPDGKYNEKGSGTIVSGNKLEGSVTSDDIGIKLGNTYKYVKFHKEPVFKTAIQNNYDPSKPYFIYPQASGGSGDNWGLSYY